MAYLKQFFDLSEAAIQSSFQKAKDALIEEGAQVEKITLDFLDVMVSIYYFLSSSEACSNLARYDGLRYGYQTDKSVSSSEEFFARNRGESLGPEVKRRILLGTFALSHGYSDQYYKKAQQLRSVIAKKIETLFQSYDLILSPVSLNSAFKLKERSVKDNLNNDVCTVLANLCGLPAVSVPIDTDEKGLPVGLQFIAPQFEEQRLFDASLFMENKFKFYKRSPEGV